MATVNLGQCADDLQPLIDDLEGRTYDGSMADDRDDLVDRLKASQTEIRNLCTAVLNLSDDYNLASGSTGHALIWS